MLQSSGLTTAQVQERRQQGLGNDVATTTSRTYKDIIVTNVFNPVNIVLYVIGFGMAAVGDLRSAFATVMLVVFNAVKNRGAVTPNAIPPRAAVRNERAVRRPPRTNSTAW